MNDLDTLVEPRDELVREIEYHQKMNQKFFLILLKVFFLVQNITNRLKIITYENKSVWMKN
jgi:hypothetical protein